MVKRKTFLDTSSYEKKNIVESTFRSFIFGFCYTLNQSNYFHLLISLFILLKANLPTFSILKGVLVMERKKI
ncbi:CLUMA_CG005475, isoform A [Clunio marinus]|uniref:CLUMA_CG005475, isoform A n=1 Tax=Clunio marinus TaxID=568069 RepID=A0A1J1HV15_9DIPT|nr:CLUMA_CG005475, isoform A [Clunio marinus]